MEALKKAKGKVTDAMLDKVFDMIESIDFVKQMLGELRKWIEKNKPITLTLTTKDGSKLETKVLGFKEGKLWLTVEGFPEEEEEEPKE